MASAPGLTAACTVATPPEHERGAPIHAAEENVFWPDVMAKATKRGHRWGSPAIRELAALPQRGAALCETERVETKRR